MLRRCRHCQEASERKNSGCGKSTDGENRPLAPWTVREYLVGGGKFLSFLADKHLIQFQKDLQLLQNAKQQLNKLVT